MHSHPCGHLFYELCDEAAVLSEVLFSVVDFADSPEVGFSPLEVVFSALVDSAGVLSLEPSPAELPEVSFLAVELA
jgi:hypothetical protein